MQAEINKVKDQIPILKQIKTKEDKFLKKSDSTKYSIENFKQKQHYS